MTTADLLDSIEGGKGAGVRFACDACRRGVGETGEQQGYTLQSGQHVVICHDCTVALLGEGWARRLGRGVVFPNTEG